MKEPTNRSHPISTYNRRARALIWQPYVLHCNTLQHILQHTATHCNTYYNTLQHTATHTTTHCATLQHPLPQEIARAREPLVGNLVSYINIEQVCLHWYFSIHHIFSQLIIHPNEYDILHDIPVHTMSRWIAHVPIDIISSINIVFQFTSRLTWVSDVMCYMIRYCMTIMSQLINTVVINMIFQLASCPNEQRTSQ